MKQFAYDTVWEKEKMQVTNIFSSSNNVFIGFFSRIIYTQILGWDKRWMQERPMT